MQVQITHLEDAHEQAGRFTHIQISYLSAGVQAYSCPSSLPILQAQSLFILSEIEATFQAYRRTHLLVLMAME